ncbi:MAG: ABC transporter permease subunit [Planctomycetes bacterium]|nr:ABC transporter permease subunit [Planctomycetota bacterium]
MSPPSSSPTRLQAATAIARRDLLEFVRDRRTLVITLLLPMVTYPILALATALGLRTASQEIDARTAPLEIRVGLSGADAPRLAGILDATLTDTPPAEREGWPASVAVGGVDRAEAAALLEQGAIDVWVDAFPGLAADLVGTETVKIPAILAPGNQNGHLVREQFGAFMRSVARDLTRGRIRRAGLPGTVLTPLTVTFPDDGRPPPEHNVTSTLAGGVLVLLTVLTLTGAFYPAIDAIAGEKERGTIETLLIAPCGLGEIVWGKFLAVFAVTLATLVANVVSIAATAAVTLRFLPQGIVAQLPQGAALAAIAVTCIAYVGLAALAAATCLAVTTASKSGKEAQNTLTPVILLVSAIAGTALLPGMRSDGPLAAMPFAGQVVVARAALGTADEAPASALGAGLCLSLASSAVLTWLLLKLTALTLADEDVLFRGPDVAGPALARPGPRLRPTIIQGLLPIVAGLAGLWYTQGFSPDDLVRAIPLQQLGAVVVPLVAVLWWQRVDWRAALSLAWPGDLRRSLVALAGAALVGSGLFVLGAAALLAVRGADISPEAQALSGRLLALMRTQPWWVAWGLMALVPALCEELLFRGWTLAAFLGVEPASGRRFWAVVAQAAAFAVFHLLPERMPQTFALGLVLGAIVVATRSLMPAIVCHLAHNSMPLVILALAGGPAALDIAAGSASAGASVPPEALLGSAAAVAVGTVLLTLAVRSRLPEDSR